MGDVLWHPNGRQERYDELCRKGNDMTEEEVLENTQLYYELHPERQYWRQVEPDRTPDSIWHKKP